MPVNTYQVANVVLSDTFTIFASKTNALISIVNGLPSVKRDSIDRRGGTIDGGVIGTSILQGENGSLFIINPDPQTGNRGIGIGDFLSSGFPNSIGSESQLYILKTDSSASINVVSTSPGGTANLNLQGTGNSAVRFLENSTTGMVIGYDDVGDRLAIRQFTSGTEVDRFTFTQAGHLELISSTPQIRLTDSDNGYYSQIRAAGGTLKFAADQGNAETDSRIEFYVDAVERMRIGDSGNVGIGTDDPQELLHIFNSGGDAGVEIQGNSNGDAYIRLSEGASHTIGAEIRYDGDDNKLLIGTGSSGTYTTRLTIMRDNPTRVGIGTNAPKVPLHIEGGTPITSGIGDSVGLLVLGATTGSNIVLDNNEIQSRFDGSSTTLLLQKQGGGLHIGDNIYGSDSLQYAITYSGGRLGIGTESPSCALEVVGGFEVDEYVIRRYKDTVEWGTASDDLVGIDAAPEIFTALGTIRYAGGPVRILCAVAGCGTGLNEEFLIVSAYAMDSPAHETEDTSDIRVISVGKTSGYPEDHGPGNKFKVYIKSRDATSAYIGILHKGGCTASAQGGSIGKTVVYTAVGAGFKDSSGNVQAGDGTVCGDKTAGTAGSTTVGPPGNYTHKVTCESIFENEDGNVGVGIDRIEYTTTGPGPHARLDVMSDWDQTNILIGQNHADGTYSSFRTAGSNKSARIAMVHYLSAGDPATAKPVSLIFGKATSTSSEVHIGGGTSLHNAATTLNFYTAVNTTTPGYELDPRMIIDKDGNVGIGTDAPDNLLHIKDISGTSAAAVNVQLHIQSANDASILLEADYLVGGSEDSNPYIKFTQDQGGAIALIGLVGNAGKDPENLDYTGTGINSFFIGNMNNAWPIHFGTNSAVRLTVHQNGNVGIGTESPDYLLDVAGDVGIGDGVGGGDYLLHNSDSDTYLRFDDDAIRLVAGGQEFLYLYEGNGNGNQLSLSKAGTDVDTSIYWTHASTPALFVEGSTGRVGIGTNTPKAPLHIYGSVEDAPFKGLVIDNRIPTYAGLSTVTTTARLSLALSENGTTDPLDRVMGFVEAGTESTSTSVHGFLALGTRINNTGSEAEQMRITSAGKVGIGTVSPDSLLHISNTSGTAASTINVRLHIESANDASIFLEADTFSAGGSGGAAGAEQSNPYIFFSQDGGSVSSVIGMVGNSGRDPINNLYTDTIGNSLFLGTQSPNIPLHLGTDGAVRLTVHQNGKVGIGTNDPTYLLDVAGDIGIGDGSVPDRLFHNGDSDTYLRFDDDAILLFAGGQRFFHLIETTQNVLRIGAAGDDVDTAIYWTHESIPALFVEGSSGYVGIGTNSPDNLLHIKDISGTSAAAVNVQLHIQSANDASILLEADYLVGGSEDSNPYIKFTQDQRSAIALIGMVGNAGKDPENLEYTGTDINSFFIGNMHPAHNIQFGTDGAVRLTITPTGKVGIGTTTPSGLLEVSGPTANIYITNTVETESGIIFRDADAITNQTAAITFDSGTGNKLRFYTGSTVATSKIIRMTLDNAGKVGIGTDAPGELLHVFNSDGEAGVRIEAGGLNTDAYLMLNERSSAGAEIRYDGTANKLFIGTGIAGSYTTRLSILRDSLGVGIGTESPVATLEVANSLFGTAASWQDGGSAGLKLGWPEIRITTLGQYSYARGDINGRLSFYSEDTDDVYPAITAAIDAIHTRSGIVAFPDTGLSFSTTWFDGSSVVPLTERMVITGRGRVGIGETDPTRSLHVKSSVDILARFKSTDSFAGIELMDNHGDYWIIASLQGKLLFRSMSGDDDRLVIDNAGNVGIGTTSPNIPLVVSGNSGNPLNITLGTIASFIDASADDVSVKILSKANQDGKGSHLFLGEDNSNLYGFDLKYDTGLNRLDFDHWTNNVKTNRMTIEGTGDVGIGTTTPDYKLDVVGTFRTSGASIIASGGGGLTVTAGGLTVSADGLDVTGDTVLSGSLTVSDAGDLTHVHDLRIDGTLHDGSNVGGVNDILTSSGAEGGPFWKSAAALDIVTGTGTNDTLIRWDAGAGVLQDSAIKEHATNGRIGIGGTPDGSFGLKVFGTSSLTTVGTATIGGALTVTTGGLTVSLGGLTVTAGGLDVDAGLTTLDDGLTVTGDTSLTGDLTVTTGGLTVSGGDTVLSGSLTVSDAGDLTHVHDLRIDGSLTDGDDTPSTGSAGQILTSTGTSIKWEGIGALGEGFLDGGGNAGKLAVWGGSGSTTTIENSIITESGSKIGINETLPDQLLHVSGTNPQIILWESDTEFVRLGVGAEANKMVLGWDDADDMQFGVFANPAVDTVITSHMTIKGPTGRVGIGIDTPSGLLEVIGRSANIYISNKTDETESGLILRDGDDRVNNSQAAAITYDSAGTNKLRFYNSGAVAGGSFPAGSVRMTIDTAGNVGIGTDSPTYLLEVAGDIGFGDGGADHLFHNGDSGTYLRFDTARIRLAASGLSFFDAHNTTQNIIRIGNAVGDIDTAIYWNHATPALFVEGSSGRVGIGTITPGKTLDVDGTFRTSGAAIIASGGGGLTVTDGGLTVTAGGLTVDVGDLHIDSGTTTLDGKLTVTADGLDVTGDTILGGSLTVNQAGKLTHVHDLRIDGTLYDKDNTAGTLNQLLTSTGSATDWKSTTTLNLPTGTGNNGKLTKWSGTNTLDDSIITESGSKIGIGTVSPDSLLHIKDISGTSAAAVNVQLHIQSANDASILLEADVLPGGSEDSNPYIKFRQDQTSLNAIIGLTGINGKDSENEDYTDTLGNSLLLGLQTGSNYPLQLGTGGAVRLTISPAGKVGIGTTTPSGLLEISGESANIYITNTNASTETESGIIFRDGEDKLNQTAAITFDSGTGNKLRFYNKASAAVRMTIDNTGNVGIGTDTPGKTLDVSGTFRTSGAVTLGGDVTITDTKAFTTGTGDVNLKGDVTIAVDKSLALSGTGSLTIAGNEALDVASELIEMQNIFIVGAEASGDRIYVLDARARYPYTIDTVYADCVSGSGTYTIKIDTVDVTGLTTVTLNTTGTETASSGTLANKTVDVGDRVTLEFPSVTDLVDAEMSIQFTRTTMAAS